MIKKTAAATTATLLVAALASGALSSGPSAVAAVDTTDSKATKGALGWGVKESFRDYVEGPIADGGIEVTPPAVREEDGTFTWKKGNGRADVDADTAKIKFKGTVYFYGHDDGVGPSLEVYVERPRLLIDGENSVLIADITSRGFASGELVEYPDVEFVLVDVTGLDLEANDRGVVTVADLPTTLTAEGAEAFAGFYGAGTSFDLISFKVKLGG